MDPTIPLPQRGAKHPGKRAWTPGASNQAIGNLSSGPIPNEQSLPAGSIDGLPRKRARLSVSESASFSRAHSGHEALPKRRTLQDLPEEILQHIFTFVHPVILGRLTCVNRYFRSLLDPSLPLPQGSSQVKRLALQSQDALWATSRKRFLQGFPRPMDEMTELQMWRLVRGRSCQFCKRIFEAEAPSQSRLPWNAGPGLHSLRTIWPFRVRSCGRCLEDRVVKVSSH
jgi:hypothetical protein